MEFRTDPAGKFLMGSPDAIPRRAAFEKPQHEVTISRPFYLDALRSLRPNGKQ